MDISYLYGLFLKSSGVTTDTRSCKEGSIFFALKGENFNGNAFATKALDSGCMYAVVDEVQYAPSNDERFILVNDVLHALQALARHHRRTLGIPMIGITGTNGKTTTKELVAAVLKTTYNTLFTQGNLNNHIGVPLTLLQLTSSHEIAVIEMGASHPGDIKELVDIAEPDYGIITNVGKAHLQGFKSLEGVIQTKGELYDYLRKNGKHTIFIDNDNPLLKNIANGLEKVTYGKADDAIYQGKVTGNSPFLSVEWHLKEATEIHQIKTHLIGAYNFPNIMAAIAIGQFFKVSSEKINTALAEYQPSNNRSQLTKTPNNLLIVDAYNANPTSMKAAIENFSQMEAPQNKLLILGEMRELGEESGKEHQHIVDILIATELKDIILVGEQFGTIKHPFMQYSDVNELISYLQKYPIKERTILIKGSNGVKLSTIVPYL